ncbi:hypothetical protein [Arthrobacter sp. H20]|uniref:hypothetical protein n=1 Tax=Arthrobacter sp. H20 TaxID=1267981 RepID=UPI0004B1D157|nr:hypothetical protein [Arthrobacter sp. H20]
MDPASFILQASIALAMVGLLTAVTALALSGALKRNDDVDSLFWYGFSGLLAVLLVIIGAAATIEGSSGMVAAGALVLIGIAAGWLWRGEHDRKSKLADEVVRSEREAVRARHDRVLQQWVTYELDPAATIDFPDMTDLSRSDTSQLIRSMRAAALLREQFDGGDVGLIEYESAVGRLETKLAAAEFAAGVVMRGSVEGSWRTER